MTDDPPALARVLVVVALAACSTEPRPAPQRAPTEAARGDAAVALASDAVQPGTGSPATPDAAPAPATRDDAPAMHDAARATRAAATRDAAVHPQPTTRDAAVHAPPALDGAADTPPTTRDGAGAAPPATLAEALRELRARGLGGAAAAIERRAKQSKRKLKLAPDQAFAAALAVLAIGDRPPLRALHAVMPRSLVELARAVAERGVPIEEADAIAAYLVRVVGALAFERLTAFDENHSHVTGRDWPEIDYSGEGMTWQQQRAHWSPRGVTDFKRAQHIHAYFVGAERLPHWKRVYRPRGRMASVTPP